MNLVQRKSEAGGALAQQEAAPSIQNFQAEEKILTTAEWQRAILDLEDAHKKLKDQKEEVSRVSGLVWFGLIVLIFMVAQMVIDSYGQREASYEKLRNEIERIHALPGCFQALSL